MAPYGRKTAICEPKTYTHLNPFLPFFFPCILIATLAKSSQFQTSPYLLLDYTKTEGMITVYQRLSCNHSEQMWEIGFRNCSFEDANISKVEKQGGRE